MLFEVFFDKNGKLRTKIRPGMFNEVFELQRYADLRTSFEFIAEALTVARADFYAAPGKGHDLAASISTKKKRDDFFVEAIYLGGFDVLRAEEDAWDTGDGKPHYIWIDPE